MKTLYALLVITLLAGCATQPKYTYRPPAGEEVKPFDSKYDTGIRYNAGKPKLSLAN